MIIRLSTIVLAVMLIAAACGPEKHESALLDSMPAGYDIYLTFNPSEVDINAVLLSLKEIVTENQQHMPWPVADILGLDPFDWSTWVETLAFNPDGEVGLVLGMENDEPYLIALFLPSTDAQLVQAFVDGLVSQAPEMDASLLVIESEGYVVLAASPEQSIIDEFEASLGTLVGTNEAFAELREKSKPGIPAVELFVNVSNLDNGEIEEMLLTCFSEESSLGFQFILRMSNSEAIEYSAIMASQPGNTGVTIPADLISAMHISFDMNAVKVMVSDLMPPDAQMGLAMLGFESIDELMDIFSGEAWFGFQTDGTNYAGVISYGLNDKEAFQDLLTRLSGMMGMADESVTTFQFQDNSCYRVDVGDLGGIETIEIGAVDDAMVIAGGYTLQQVSDGISFDSYLEHTGLNITDEGGFTVAADLGALAAAFDLNAETDDILDFEKFGYLALSGTSDADIYILNGSVDFGSGNPFAFIADAIAVMAVADTSEPVIELRTADNELAKEDTVTPPAEEQIQPDSITTEAAAPKDKN